MDEDIRSRAFWAIQQAFPCESSLRDNIDLDSIISSFKSDLQPSNKPFFIRLAGQSGTGKTTHFLPIIIEELKGISFVPLAVAKFAPFYPGYENMRKDEVRERTNGFALRTMILFIEYCMKNRISIVLDFTLLNPALETYLYTLAKENGYACITHLMCVPKKASDTFIKLREQQTGRKVSPKTAFYVFTTIPKTVKALSKLDIFNSNDKIILWTNCKLEPIWVTGYNDRRCLSLLNEYRSLKYIGSCNIAELQAARKAWVMNFVKEYQQDV